MTLLQPLEVPPAQAFDVGLLDLDGVVYRGPAAVEHAPEAIAIAQSAGLSLMYVTNNANRPPTVVADHLTEIGIPTGPDEVTTAAQAAASLIAAEYPAKTRVLVVGGIGLRQAVEAAGLVLVESADDHPAVVVQGFAPEVGWTQLTEALLAITAGAEHIATNLDATLPMERGTAIGNGSLVAAIVNATGRMPRSTGKPAAAIFQQAAARAGAQRPIVVGDRLDTDLEGARAAGYAGMHVLTGVDLGGALLACLRERRPTQLAHDLRGLLEPHPAVERDGDWWRCRDAVARFEHSDGSVTVARAGTQLTLADEAEIDLDELRAACVAAWDAADRAGAPTVLSSSPQVRVRPPGNPAGAIA